MKLCFSTLGCTELSLDEILILARAFDIHALEIRGIGGVMDNRKIAALSPENAPRTSELLAQNRVRPQVLGTSCAFHDSAKTAAAIEEGKASIDIAARLGIPYIRVFGNKLVGEGEAERATCTARVAAGIAEVCDYAAGTPVSVLLEVHGDYNTIETLSPILAALGVRSNFGLIWDIAHTRAYGVDWQVFYREMKPYIRHVHIKDASLETGKLTLLGEGDLPIVPITRALLADGFDGYFSLEWERKWHPELPDLSVALERFTEIMGTV